MFFLFATVIARSMVTDMIGQYFYFLSGFVQHKKAHIAMLESFALLTKLNTINA